MTVFDFLETTGTGFFTDFFFDFADGLFLEDSAFDFFLDETERNIGVRAIHKEKRKETIPFELPSVSCINPPSSYTSAEKESKSDEWVFSSLFFLLTGSSSHFTL